MVVSGFKIVSAILDVVNKIQQEREFVQRMNGITAEQRVALLRELDLAQEEFRLSVDPERIRAKVDALVQSVRNRVAVTKVGERIPDVFGTGGAV